MMNDNISKIPGPERAAIFMMSMGEQSAAEILKHMGPKEVQRVGTAMASLKNVSNATVQLVLNEFVKVVEERSAVGVDSDEYIRKVLVGALGEDKAGGVIDRILLGRNSKGLDSLKWMDPRAVADVVHNEHPQIIAIVLSYLESDHAAEVLNHLPTSARTDVLMRIATLDGVAPAALQELNEVLEKQFSGNTNIQSSGVGGVRVAANILNFMETAEETTITAAISAQDATLAEAIQEQMFVFENLIEVDDRGFQTILREIQTDQLVIALKGADDAMKEKIYKNMSTRAAEMLREDLDAKGPVRVKDVTDAQKEILAVARRLAEAGEISLGGKGEEEYV